MTMISRGGRNLAQKRTMKNAGNEKTLESIYKNGKICFPKRRWSNVCSRHNVVYNNLIRFHRTTQKGKCLACDRERHLPVLYPIYAVLRHESLRGTVIRKRYDDRYSRRCRHPDKDSEVLPWLRLSFRRQ